jgi:hypothetical protein
VLPRRLRSVPLASNLLIYEGLLPCRTAASRRSQSQSAQGYERPPTVRNDMWAKVNALREPHKGVILQAATGRVRDTRATNAGAGVEGLFESLLAEHFGYLE